ncbi:MAG: OB-fold nucleic acid binding domain-containing protein, partial [Flavobacteriales bacterium]
MLYTPIEFLKGVGPQRGELLRKDLNIATYGDLLQHFPFRFVDRSVFHRVREINEELNQVQLRGKLGPIKLIGEKQGRRLTSSLTDATGTIELVWFKGIRWLQTSLKPGQEYVVFGKPTVFNGRFNLAHPELELATTLFEGLVAGPNPGVIAIENAERGGLSQLDKLRVREGRGAALSF